jgi:hypothetical protein
MTRSWHGTGSGTIALDYIGAVRLRHALKLDPTQVVKVGP